MRAGSILNAPIVCRGQYYTVSVTVLKTRKIPSTTIAKIAVALMDSDLVYSNAALRRAHADQMSMIRFYLLTDNTSLPLQSEGLRRNTARHTIGTFNIIAWLSSISLAVLFYELVAELAYAGDSKSLRFCGFESHGAHQIRRCTQAAEGDGLENR